MNSSGCRRARSWIAQRAWPARGPRRENPTEEIADRSAGYGAADALVRRASSTDEDSPVEGVPGSTLKQFQVSDFRFQISNSRGRAMNLGSVTLATLAKDIRLEWRSKDSLNSMLFFSLLVVVIFSFSFDPLAEESRHIAGGLIWVAILFAAVVALNQTWARELRNQVLDAYRVSPAPANALFLAKALGNFIFVSLLEALMAPLFVMFYNLRVLGPAWQLIPITLFGTWALVVNGTFFAAMSVRTRSRELMLPLLLFPISIPAVIAMVEGTTSILTGDDSAHFYIMLLLTYDVVFTTACLALFDTILHAE